MAVFRCDQGLIVKPEKTDEGFLRCMFRFRKVGELPYLNADGTRHIEVVTRENLLNTDSLKTARMKPIAQLHPSGKVITAENSHLYMRGMSGEAMLTDGDYTMISGCVTHSELIDKILSGELSDVSSGYWSDKVPRNDGKFDQVNARYNHFAGVPYGRAGPDVNWFSADEADPLPEGFAVQDIDTADLRLNKPKLFIPTPVKRKSMINSLKLDDVTTLAVGESEGEQTLAKHLRDLLKITADSADLEVQLSAEKAAAIALQAERDQQQARADMAEAKAKELETAKVDAAEIDKAFQAGKDRAALETRIAAITGTEIRADASDRELKIAAISKRLNTDAATYAEKPDAYIDAAYEIAIATDAADATKEQMRSVTPTTDAAPMMPANQRVRPQDRPIK
jgi:hypothetical protein